MEEADDGFTTEVPQTIWRTLFILPYLPFRHYRKDAGERELQHFILRGP